VATLNDYDYSDYDGGTTETCDASEFEAAVFLKEPRIVMNVNDNLSFEER